MDNNDAWLICVSCEGKICTIIGTKDELGKTGYKCPNKDGVIRIVMEGM